MWTCILLLLSMTPEKSAGLPAKPHSLVSRAPSSPGATEPLFSGLGSHRRKVVTSSPRAQKYFDQGLNFLFGFNMVHMPSHINVRCGRWKEAIVANERAIEADRKYRAQRPRQGFYRLYMLHNQHMLAYSAIMRGGSDKAIKAVDKMIASVCT